MKSINDELLNRVKDAIQIQSEIRNLLLKDKDIGSDLPIRDFIMLMQMLTPQSYGCKIQARLIKQLGFKSINNTKDTGDCEDSFGDKWEIKSSIINASNNSLNLVQIRLWQDIKGYVIVVFDTRINPMEIQVYRIDINQMKKECELCNASSAHGTKKANKNNENIELRFSIKIDKNDYNFKRWQQYRSKFNFSDLT
jgi:hypothetical protein